MPALLQDVDKRRYNVRMTISKTQRKQELPLNPRALFIEEILVNL